jgi:5-hydroxyisourate hydrolase-like protein (transthyretin family)
LKLLYEAIDKIDPIADFRNYSRLIFIYVDSPANNLCGLGSIGKWSFNSSSHGNFTASFAMINDTCFASGAISHEFGHNLGFWHASSILSIPESLVDPTYAGGSWTEYGDLDDTMGSSNGYRHYSSIWKSQAQWIETAQIHDVTTSGEYVLDQVELLSTGVKALRIRLGNDKNGDDFYYWIEYRNNLGTFDKQDVVQVRTQSSGTYSGGAWSDNTLIFNNFSIGGSISGRVTQDLDGAAIEKLGIVVRDASLNWVTSTSTDSSGHYRVSGLPAGSYYVGTYNDLGYIDEYYNNVTTQSAATQVSVILGSSTPNIDFGLTPGGSISGRVTKDTDGTGIQGVWIWIYDTTWQWVNPSQTDSSGSYTVSKLPAGSYYVGTSNDLGYINEYYNNVTTSSAATQVSVVLGSSTPNIDFGLTLGGSISGRVTKDTDGTGIQGVWITIYDTTGQWVQQSQTDSSGNYTVTKLPAGSYYVGTYNDLGYINEYYNNVTTQSAATQVSVILGSSTPNIDFGLTLGGSIWSQAVKDSSAIQPQNVGIHILEGSLNSDRITPTESGANYLMRSCPTPSRYLTTSNNKSYLIPGGNATTSNDGVDVGKAFHDPYRGVKIEVLEKMGNGSESKAKLKVTLSGVNINPEENLDLGSIRVKNSSSGLVRVTNNSVTPLAIGVLSIGGRDPGLFSIITDGCSNKNLVQNAPCDVTISFSPDSEGDKFGVLIVPNSDDIRPKASISLYGIGTSESVTIPNTPTGPTKGVTGASYNYSTWGSSSNLGHSVEYQFDWKGDGSDLSAWGSPTQTKTWTVPGVYNVRARARCKSDTTVVSEWSGTLSVNIISNPTLTVLKSGTGSGTVTSSPAGINCGSDCSESYDQGTSVTLTATPASGSIFGGWSGACSGTGTCVVIMNADIAVTAAFSAGPPDISVSPSSLDFGSVKSGKKTTKTLKIMNNGSGNLVITLSGLEGTEFSIQGSSTVTIKAKKSYSLKVLCTPTSGGLKTTTLKIDSNDPDTPTLEISLTAALPATTPDISIAQTSIEFGSVKVGKKGTKTLKITNNGTGDLVITLSGLEGTDFSIQGRSSVTIKAKKSYSLKVLFTPKSAGLETANLELSSNDPDTPTLEISLSGTGQ